MTSEEQYRRGHKAKRKCQNRAHFLSRSYRCVPEGAGARMDGSRSPSYLFVILLLMQIVGRTRVLARLAR